MMTAFFTAGIAPALALHAVFAVILAVGEKTVRFAWKKVPEKGRKAVVRTLTLAQLRERREAFYRHFRNTFFAIGRGCKAVGRGFKRFFKAIGRAGRKVANGYRNMRDEAIRARYVRMIEERASS